MGALYLEDEVGGCAQAQAVSGCFSLSISLVFWLWEPLRRELSRGHLTKTRTTVTMNTRTCEYHMTITFLSHDLHIPQA